jgi:hypothetical protein
VTPEGNLVDGDVIVVSGLAPAAGPSCASVLLPAIDPGDLQAATLPEESVSAVLAAIGLGGMDGTWVSTEGRWANGVLTGHWRKDAAGYIGEGAREAARRARIARLSGELDQARIEIAGLDVELAELERRRERLAEEHRATPPDTDVRDAHTVAAAERRRRGQLRERQAEAVGQSPAIASRQAATPALTPASSPGSAGRPTSRANSPALRTATSSSSCR